MKKVLFSAIGLTAVLGLASCSQEDGPMTAADGVNITVCLPRDMQARGTFGDGTDTGDRAVLNNLQYSVYEVADGVTAATPLFSGALTNAFQSSQTVETVTLPLAKGKSYQVAFYADDSDNDFVTYTDGVINVDYSKAASNTAAEDAFIGKSTQFIVDGAYAETVTLTRPFAQLNWGTNDLDADVLKEVLKSLTATVTVSSGLYTSMNVITGDVDNAVSDATSFAPVAFTSLPDQTFPVSGYSLIAMNYLLTGKGTIDCTLSFNDAKDGLTPVTVSQAPVQTNYRTNIYGQLLTSPAEFNILVDNNFEDTDNDIEYKDIPKWDGTVTPVTPVDNVYTLETPEQVAYFFNNMKSSDIKNGMTVNITSDMDFSGHDWTSKTIKANGDTGYSLTIDFNGHIIYGLSAALMDMYVGTMKNVTFANCNITGTVNENGFMGIVANNYYGTLDNVNIQNCVLNCTGTNRSVGGICGQYTSGNASNCTVDGLTINNGTDYKAGGLFGSVNQESPVRTFTNLAAKDVNIVDYNGQYGGALIGRVYGCNLTLTNCTQTGCFPSAIYGAALGGAVVTEN